MLRISEQIRNITKDSPHFQELLDELSAVVILCDDIMDALDSYDKGLATKALNDLVSFSFVHLNEDDVKKPISLLKKVLVNGDIITNDVDRSQIRRILVEFKESLKLLKQKAAK
jgi:hypothetical protein